MLTRVFGKTGWEVSAIGQGCWNIGNQWGEVDEQTALDLCRAAFDHGMNLFDVAESYGIPNGLSEIRLGKALRGIRDRVYIVSKIGHWGKRTGQEVPKTTSDMIRLCGHACCGRLHSEHVDLMLCHEGNIQDPGVYIEGFRRLRDEGFIRAYGISTDSIEVLKHFWALSDRECAAVEVNYSLVNKDPEDAFLPWCKQHNLGVLVRGPMARGLLSGRYDRDSVFTDPVREKWNEGESGRDDFLAKMDRVDRIRAVTAEDLPTVALRYVISHRANPVAIPGATRITQAIANAKAGDQPLPPEIYAELHRT